MAQYEFSEANNRAFDALGSSLRRFSVAVGALALLMIVYGVFGMARGHFGGTTLMVLIGGSAVVLVLVFLFRRPLDNLRRISTEKGKDISELGTAIDDLSTAHNLLRVIIGVWILIQAVGFFLKASN